MKIFAVYNIKGGVGKTTTAVNLAYLSASEGARTLIWDLDPQGSTSYYLCIQPKIKGGAEHLLNDKIDLNAMVRMTGYPNLDMLPADISFRSMDILIDAKKNPLAVLQKLLKPLSQSYDHIFLDCPPSLSLMAENVFQVADFLLIPLIPTTLSLKAYNRLIQFLVKQRTNRLKVVPFFNLYNASHPIHQAVIRNVCSRHELFVREPIPESNRIEAMGVKRSPIFTYARDSPEAASYRNLWREIKNRGKLT